MLKGLKGLIRPYKAKPPGSNNHTKASSKNDTKASSKLHQGQQYKYPTVTF